MHAAFASRLRILVIDDNPSIQEDFRKILSPTASAEAAFAAAQQALFGDNPPASQKPKAIFEIDAASQAEEGLRMLEQSLTQGSPYAVVFVDVRMPPGMDGILATARILKLDPHIQVVICTAFSDYSWDEIRHRLGPSDRILILKKPFDVLEVLQLADTLSTRWQAAHQIRQRLDALDHMIDARTRELNASVRQMDALQQQLAAAAQQHQVTARNRGQSHDMHEDELKRAIETGELSVHYQPLIDCSTQRLISLEALARWQHPQRGWISPDKFIPLAEQTGLILPLGEFVLQQVCAQVMKWQREQLQVVPVAVNISAIQLQQQDLAELVRRVLREAGMRPELLALEITESALICDTQSHSGHLQALRGDGVLIEIDDFGTGYSSLSYLRHLPVDTLKIDRSFIANLETNVKEKAIVSAIIAMAHTLGIKVVAEGVETAAQLTILRGLGCEYVQGYYVSRPMPATGCRKWLIDAARYLNMIDACTADRSSKRMLAAVR